MTIYFNDYWNLRVGSVGYDDGGARHAGLAPGTTSRARGLPTRLLFAGKGRAAEGGDLGSELSRRRLELMILKIE